MDDMPAHGISAEPIPKTPTFGDTRAHPFVKVNTCRRGF